MAQGTKAGLRSGGGRKDRKRENKGVRPGQSKNKSKSTTENKGTPPEVLREQRKVKKTSGAGDAERPQARVQASRQDSQSLGQEGGNYP